MNEHDKIAQFLGGAPHAVVGASRDSSKIGNRVLQAYLQTQRPVYPVNPAVQEIEGVKAYPDLASLPTLVHGVSVVTPPHLAESIVEQAGAIGVKNIWFQPGAESDPAVARAQELGMNVIAGGPCILVVLGYRTRSKA
jgi:predicted CoA-binding protein